MFQNSNSRITFLKAAENITIPKNGEMLIKGYFTGYGPYQQGIVEASKFVQNKCFLVVKSIVNAENKCQVVSILNFDENPVKLKRNDT